MYVITTDLIVINYTILTEVSLVLICIETFFRNTSVMNANIIKFITFDTKSLFFFELVNVGDR